MPTALARPWPSGPVVVSTPGVTPTSGWPGRLRVQLAEVLAARPSAGRSRSGAAARTAASSRGRWTARSGRDSASADWPGCGAGGGSTARRRSRPCPSACRDGRSWPLRTASIASARIALASKRCRRRTLRGRGGRVRCCRTGLVMVANWLTAGSPMRHASESAAPKLSLWHDLCNNPALRAAKIIRQLKQLILRRA